MSTSRAIGSSSSPASPARARVRSPSTRSSPRASASTWSRSPPTPASSSTSSRSPMWRRSRASRPPSPSSSAPRAQPALHRRHDDRDLRLPAPALRPLRHADLLGAEGRARRTARSSSAAASAIARPERQRRSSMRRHGALPRSARADGPRAGRPRQEGLPREVLERSQRTASSGPGSTARLSTCAKCSEERREPAQARALREAHHRGGRSTASWIKPESRQRLGVVEQALRLRATVRSS
jgi:hypothetical protein